MLDNQNLARKVTAFKKDSRKDFDKAVAALIALAYKYRKFGADFLWDKDPELNDGANEICRDLSDAVAEKAKSTAAAIMEDFLDYYDLDASWDRESGEWYVPVITRLDQQGSFLKELLEVWIALAFVYGLSQGALKVEISRFLANPFLSRYWKDLPMDILKWGSGYQKDIAAQIGMIGQDAIIAAARYAEWSDAAAKGAEWYVRRRGSDYNCDECQDLANKPIPISVPWDFTHARCQCYAEYHYGPMPE